MSKTDKNSLVNTLLMNTLKNSNAVPESMQRMITPQYEQIVNEIDNMYHNPETGL